MDSATSLTKEPERAAQQVDRFVRRFEPSYRLLAYYAALPLVITPELLNYLRNQFLRSEEVPWVAEVDLLLSDLCRTVGYEQYAMDTAVRAYLFSEMERELGYPKIEAASRLLINYIHHLAQTNPYLGRQELEVQQWAAMAYLEDQRSEVVRQIASAYQNSITTDRAGSASRAEMARLSRITKELAPQLREYADLLAYAELVRRFLEDPTQVSTELLTRSYKVLEDVELRVPEPWLPTDRRTPLQSFEFDVATVELGSPTELVALQPFEFEIATVEIKKSGGIAGFGRSPQVIIHRRSARSQQIIEDLGNGISLEMVAIPAGSFVMGSPDREKGRSSSEDPQHTVTLSSFFLGKYPVTQAQWKAVAALTQVNRSLDPDPSRFKGETGPVECISWLDAIEFCDRLSQLTGRPYRLPSEAEWEYACRAGTTTPFHFGEIITTDLANYNGDYTYGDGPKGVYRRETTPVGSFGVANAFGLYDMHGNVWEWCMDHWHENYEDAPIDGSAWINLSASENASRLLRGGSWVNYPRGCRSAFRNWLFAGGSNLYFGFRVACSA
jgi:formylglycine-generating enzyme required for sulfatase activity